MDRETALLLAQSGHSAPSADNSQPICFIWSGDTLQISYDAPRVEGVTFAPDSPATLLAVGAVLENLARIDQLYTLEMHIELPGADQPTGYPYATISVAGSAAGATPRRALPLSTRHTNRFPYDRDRAIPDAIRRVVDDLSEGQARLQRYESPGLVTAISRLAQRAAEIRFQSQEVHELLAHSLRYTTAQADSGDGMDVRTLHLPPGGSLFMRLTSDWARMRLLNKAGAYKFMAMVDSKLLAQAPMILAVIGVQDRAGAIAAGKLLCRTWTKLNEQGLAVHPYYVVSDQIARLREGLVPRDLIRSAEKCKLAADTMFELQGGETLYMLLRVGFATRDAPRSRRLPLELVFKDRTDDGADQN